MISRTQHYCAPLDSLRAIAILLVMLQHYLNIQLFPAGFLGVRLFFVLSGYLITLILISAQRKKQFENTNVSSLAKHFYKRRSLRLFPIYYLVIIVGLVFYFLGMDFMGYPESLPWHALYASNFYIVSQQSWVGPPTHLWTLSVEVQFYFLWFFIMLYLPPIKIKKLCLALILIAPIYRSVIFFLNLEVYYEILLPGCMDSICCGALLALSSHNKKDIPDLFKSRRFFGLSGYFILALLLIWYSVAYQRDHALSRILLDSLASFCFTLLVYLCIKGLRGTTKTILEWRWLSYIGKISYGIYIYHNFIPLLYFSVVAYVLKLVAPNLMQPLLNNYYSFHVAMFFVLTLCVSALSWHFFEKKFLVRNR